MYSSKIFQKRSLEEFKQDLNYFLKIGEKPKRIFLLDGNAFCLSTSTLLSMTESCFDIFPGLQRVSCYAHVNDILAKTQAEMKELRDAGLSMVYCGLETATPELLKQYHKNHTTEQMKAAIEHCFESQMKLSATVMLGLSGENIKQAELNGKTLASFFNQVNYDHNPIWYLSALTTMAAPGSELFERVQKGQFIPANPITIATELREFFRGIKNPMGRCIFRSNHASNYLPLSSNNLGADSVMLYDSVNEAIKKHNWKNEMLRGL
jgi:radical SAM superfamily enzyme YgiQ (UPF0313 family)